MATPFDPTKAALLQPAIQRAAAGSALGPVGTIGGLLSGIGGALSNVPAGVNPRMQAQGTGQQNLDDIKRRDMAAQFRQLGDSVDQFRSPQEAPVEAPAAAQAPQAAPQPDPIEGLRQQAERGFQVQVAKGELPTRDIAESIVEGQAKQAGEDLSKEEKVRRVSQERKLIDNMPDEQKPNYLSWALIAAGLIASAVDEDAGYYFADSYNQTRKQAAEAAEKQLERESRKAERQEDREFRSEEAALDRESRANLSAEEFKARREMLDEELKVRRDQMGQQAAYQNARLSLLQQKNDLAAQGGDMPGQSKGITLGSDDAKALVKGISNDLGLNLSEGVEANAAAFLQNALKFNPNADPALVLDTWIKRNEKNLGSEKRALGFLPFVDEKGPVQFINR
ncbi:hypothetical protein SXHG_00112 [Synechococcus phage MRHenn-2013a]|nr:hypothetical protein SXHG_00112 [Synechococcus phage MRHenn-2013a]